MSYNTYEKYKDSGIEWIGEIPEHWEVKKLKFVLKSSLKYGANEIAEFDEKEFPRYIRITDFGSDGKLRLDTFKSLPPEKAKDYLLEEGDILFARSGATVGKTFQFKGYSGQACFAGYLIKASVNQKLILSDYLYLFTKSGLYEDWKNSIFNQATIQNIGADKYSVFEISLPPLKEQAAITNYLNYKNLEIDELIADKQRLLALYEEEKTAIINQAVTKGINPDAPMKDSGIEWLGEIPAHWEVKKLKNLVSKIGSGVTPSGGSTVYLKSGIPLLRSQNIHFDGLKLEDVAYISEEIDESMKNSRIQAKDVLLNITGASIGRCYYLPDDFEYGNVNQHVCILRPKIDKIDTKYLYFLMRSELGQLQIALQQTGANREGLNFEQLRNFLFCIPSVKEQKNIIRELENETDKVNTKITRTQKLIDLLTEYKTALISEVVTGKIKVSN